MVSTQSFADLGSCPSAQKDHRYRMSFPFEWPRDVSGFVFVLNPFHYTGKLPLELFPGARLELANQIQTKLIKELRDSCGRAGKSMAFDREPIPKDVRDSPQWDRKLWPRSSFWLINFDVDAEEVIRFRRASQLTNNEIEFGAIFPSDEQPFLPRVVYPWTIESYFDTSWHNDAEPLDLEHLTLTRELAQKVSTFRDEQDNPAANLIVQVFDDFIELSQEHRISHLRLLGHFGLLEALITHHPAESRQRLSHQVRTKMPLLMHRFRQCLDIRNFFALTNEDETWRLLYRLRSCYAHGEKPDFDKSGRDKGGRDEGGVKELNNLREAFRFVRESLKRLLILALDEPQLISDLKTC